MKYTTIILAGPSGVGKTFLASLLIDKYPLLFEHAPVYVTRDKRKNEEKIAIGRVFQTVPAFKQSLENSEFLIHEYFAQNYYGYKEDSFKPTGKYLLVDVSPYLLQYALVHCVDPIVIILQPSENLQSLLVDRLKSRGDSQKVIEERKSFILRDISDIEMIKLQASVEGKIFSIEDNSTIPINIIPWIEKQLDL